MSSFIPASGGYQLPSFVASDMIQLIYKYTVTGADKASIDTGVDSPDAGSNDWTNGDLLEMFFYGRTDLAANLATYNLTFNNDTGGNYDSEFVDLTNATITGGDGGRAGTKLQFNCLGSSAGSNRFGVSRLTIPNYNGTTSYKAGEGIYSNVNTLQSNSQMTTVAFLYQSTAAIARLAITPNTGGTKFKVGSQLLIYKRLSN